MKVRDAMTDEVLTFTPERNLRDAAKFMADQEWSDIKKKTGAKHGKLVGEIQDRTLTLTPYSPRKDLLSGTARAAIAD